jgi:hemolysin-activating ACP:hemolysin acyltransferase
MYLDGIKIHCDCTLHSTTYCYWCIFDNEPNICYLSEVRHNRREKWLREFTFLNGFYDFKKLK